MADFNVDFSGANEFDVTFEGNGEFGAGFGNVGIVQVGHYAPLPDKPSINGEVLLGDKPVESFGITNLTNTQIKAIFDRVFKKGD